VQKLFANELHPSSKLLHIHNVRIETPKVVALGDAAQNSEMSIFFPQVCRYHVKSTTATISVLRTGST
jgi:hypothetical protein